MVGSGWGRCRRRHLIIFCSLKASYWGVAGRRWVVCGSQSRGVVGLSSEFFVVFRRWLCGWIMVLHCGGCFSYKDGGYNGGNSLGDCVEQIWKKLEVQVNG